MAKSYDLLVKAKGDTRDAQRSIAQLQKRVGQFGRGISQAGRALTLGVTVPVAAMARVGTRELIEMQKATAQTGAVILSTGGSANVTARHIESMSQQLLKVSGVDDQLIQQGANLMLTFTNVRNEVGRGNKVFDQATRAALDMSTALGEDMTASAMRIGKALNDPVKGVTALRRVGVHLTAQQEKQIKTFMKHGKTMKAQKVILRELNKEFGGSAKAFGGTLAGRLGKLKEQFAGISAEMVTNMLPSIERVADTLDSAMTKFQKLPKHTQQAAGSMGLLAAAMGPIAMAVGPMVSSLSSLGPAMVAAAPAVAVIAAAGSAFAVAYKYSKQFKDTVTQGMGGALKNFSGIGREAAKLSSTVSELARKFPGLKTAVFAFGQVIEGVMTGGVASTLGLIGGVSRMVRGVLQIFNGSFKAGIKNVFGGLGQVMLAPFRPVIGFVRGMVRGVKTAFMGMKLAVLQIVYAIGEQYQHVLQKMGESPGPLGKKFKRMAESMRQSNAYLYGEITSTKGAISSLGSAASKSSGDMRAAMRRSIADAKSFGGSVRAARRVWDDWHPPVKSAKLQIQAEARTWAAQYWVNHHGLPQANLNIGGGGSGGSGKSRSRSGSADMSGGLTRAFGLNPAQGVNFMGQILGGFASTSDALEWAHENQTPTISGLEGKIKLEMAALTNLVGQQTSIPARLAALRKRKHALERKIRVLNAKRRKAVKQKKKRLAKSLARQINSATRSLEKVIERIEKLTGVLESLPDDILNMASQIASDEASIESIKKEGAESLQNPFGGSGNATDGFAAIFQSAAAIGDDVGKFSATQGVTADQYATLGGTAGGHVVVINQHFTSEPDMFAASQSAVWAMQNAALVP